MLVNLTPHEVVVVDDRDAPTVRLDSVGVIRVPTEVRATGEVRHGEVAVPLYETVYHDDRIELTGMAMDDLLALPAGTTLVVSLVSVEATRRHLRAAGRDDLLVVSPGEVLRDASGQPRACRGLST